MRVPDWFKKIYRSLRKPNDETQREIASGIELDRSCRELDDLLKQMTLDGEKEWIRPDDDHFGP